MEKVTQRVQGKVRARKGRGRGTVKRGGGRVGGEE